MLDKVNDGLKALFRWFHVCGMVRRTKDEAAGIGHSRPCRNEEGVPRCSCNQRDRVDPQAGLEEDFQMIETGDGRRRFPQACGKAILDRSSAQRCRNFYQGSGQFFPDIDERTVLGFGQGSQQRGALRYSPPGDPNQPEVLPAGAGDIGLEFGYFLGKMHIASFQ